MDGDVQRKERVIACINLFVIRQFRIIFKTRTDSVWFQTMKQVIWRWKIIEIANNLVIKKTIKSSFWDIFGLKNVELVIFEKSEDFRKMGIFLFDNVGKNDNFGFMKNGWFVKNKTSSEKLAIVQKFEDFENLGNLRVW